MSDAMQTMANVVRDTQKWLDRSVVMKRAIAYHLRERNTKEPDQPNKPFAS